jgi:hypothetical protein
MLFLLLPLLGCDPIAPHEGTPGLEPPHERFGDGGAVRTPDDDGMAASQGGSRAPGGAMESPEHPSSNAGNGGTAMMPTASAGSGGATGMMMPTTTGPPSDSADDEDGGTDVDTQSPLFVGLWVIEQGSPAEYQATLYELQAGGDLLQHDTFDFAPPPYEGFVTGTVERAAGDVRCSFEQRWRADAARALRVDARCTDGVTRSIVLAFPEGDELQGIAPAVASVAGEREGWAHAGHAWTFRKCKSRELCFPF